jgi:hypothetical protein
MMGQEMYHPVNMATGRWLFTQCYRVPGAYEVTIDTLLFYFHGDTIIHDMNYTHLIVMGHSYSIKGSDTTYTFLHKQAGAMYNDTLHRQVWFNGHCAYDYNLSLWDTIQFGIYQGKIIGAIDSVHYCDSWFRRYQFYGISGNGPLMIQNIRALDIVIMPYINERGWCTLECYYESDNTSCSSCPIEIIPRADISPSLTIFPNPATELVYISGISGSVDIDMVTLTGQQVYHCQGVDCSISLPLNGLAKGIYFLCISGSQYQRVEKIVVQ